MPRKKAAGNCSILPWLSGKGDNKEGRFVQVGNSLLLSRDFQTLTAGARWLYLCMTMEAGGKREFAFSHSAAKKYGIPGSSFDRQIQELKEAGFVEVVPDEDRAQFAPNRFRFCFGWKMQKTSNTPFPPSGSG